MEEVVPASELREMKAKLDEEKERVEVARASRDRQLDVSARLQKAADRAQEEAAKATDELSLLRQAHCNTSCYLVSADALVARLNDRIEKMGETIRQLEAGREAQTEEIMELTGRC